MQLIHHSYMNLRFNTFIIARQTNQLTQTHNKKIVLNFLNFFSIQKHIKNENSKTHKKKK